MANKGAIKPIDKTSVHRITSGQVVIELQTAVKELVENSLDAEVRFKQYGLKSIEVVDNGSGIAEQYHDTIALKHYTSKLSSFSDLATVRTFGFRGEALSSLCALSESVVVTTATEPPMGVSLEMEASGKVGKRTKIARQRGTTVVLSNLFSPLPVRRKEFERNSKRESGKALALLNAYALGPCCTSGAGVRLTVSNQIDKGQKTVQLRTSGASSARASVSALWGPKALDNIVDLDLTFEVEKDKASLRRVQSLGDASGDTDPVPVTVKGLISKFSVGGGRTGTDRQYFYVNGRPCNLTKIQKAFNEVYRSFSANQAPFILADFILPTESCDINVSPDKRTIFLHSENNMIIKLKAALEETFAPSRSTYDVGTSQTQSTLPAPISRTPTHKRARSESEEPRSSADDRSAPSKKRPAPRPPSPPGDEELDGQEDGSIPSSEPLFMADDVDLESLRPGTSSAVSSALVDTGAEPPLSPTVSQMVSAPTAQPGPVSMMDRPSPAPTPSSRAVSPTVPIITTLGAGGDDSMVIDEDDDPLPIDDRRSPVASRDDRESTVVIDTTQATLGRSAREKDSPPRDDAGGPPPQKKSTSFLDSFPAAKGTSRTGRAGKEGKRTKASATSAKVSRDGLRNRLVGFARTGSQVLATQEAEVDVEDMDHGEPSDEMEEDQLDPSSDVDRRAEGSEGEDGGDRPGVTQPSTPPVEDGIGQSSSKAIDLTSEDELDDSHISVSMFAEPSSVLPQEETISHPEVIRSSDNGHGDVSLRFDITKVSDTWRRLHAEITETFDVPAAASPLPRVPSAAGVSNTENDERAVDALARVIEKKDFGAMEVVGQFNLGFIVTRRRKALSGGESGDGDGDGDGEDEEPAGAVMDDLFIVDQHAADEKYNFETLQQTTSIKSQKLFRPRAMELTASDELLAIENMDVLRQNGFEVEEVGEEECMQGSRLRLTAQPVSKSTVFDMKDLEELIHLMRDRPTGQMVRCSKARAMFAMRACRKSVMVGMPLTKQQMSLVVNHMGTMDQPWNCPHGRPTMRHLLDISNQKIGKQSRQVDWSAFRS